jgi:hypothetical protein
LSFANLELSNVSVKGICRSGAARPAECPGAMQVPRFSPAEAAV